MDLRGFALYELSLNTITTTKAETVFVLTSRLEVGTNYPMSAINYQITPGLFGFGLWTTDFGPLVGNNIKPAQILIDCPNLFGEGIALGSNVEGV